MDQYDRRVTRSTIDDAMASQRHAEESDMRLVLPLPSFIEQISGLRARVLLAVDDLAAHSNRVGGSEPMGTLASPSEDLGRKVSAARLPEEPSALDRIAAELIALEGAVQYLEAQTVRATGLA